MRMKKGDRLRFSEPTSKCSSKLLKVSPDRYAPHCAFRRKISANDFPPRDFELSDSTSGGFMACFRSGFESHNRPDECIVTPKWAESESSSANKVVEPGCFGLFRKILSDISSPRGRSPRRTNQTTSKRGNGLAPLRGRSFKA